MGSGEASSVGVCVSGFVQGGGGSGWLEVGEVMLFVVKERWVVVSVVRCKLFE